MDSFCEEDYAVTNYIAEFINCLSSFVYGMPFQASQPPPPQRPFFYHVHQPLPARVQAADYRQSVYYALGYSVLPGTQYRFGFQRGHAFPDLLSVALCIVGLASAAFHGTLRQGAQFSDDLSMLLLGASLMQTVWTYGQNFVISAILTTTIALGTCASMDPPFSLPLIPLKFKHP